jgi:hypothetical protein
VQRGNFASVSNPSSVVACSLSSRITVSGTGLSMPFGLTIGTERAKALQVCRLVHFTAVLC